MGYNLATCVFWKKKLKKKKILHVLVTDSLSFHLHFLKKKYIKRIKIKNDVILSLFESLMESFTVQDIFFPLLISATHVFSLQLSPTQTQLLS